MTSNRKGRFVHGWVLPILVLCFVSFFVASIDSGANAEGFAYIMILVMLIVAVPITLIGNLLIVPISATKKSIYFAKGMILPAIAIGSMLVYQTGLWDHGIRPLFPRHVEKIQTAGGGRAEDGYYESFFVVENYTGSAEDKEAIEAYALERHQENMWRSKNQGPMNERYYFVPREVYDPIDDSVSRENAVAVFQDTDTDGNTTLKHVE